MADLLVHGAIDNSYFLVDLAFVFWLCLALVGMPQAGENAIIKTKGRIDTT